MAGLKKLCKLYGRMNVMGILWIWDYANDKPRKSSDMTLDEIKKSEEVKWMGIEKQLNKKYKSKTNPKD